MVLTGLQTATFLEFEENGRCINNDNAKDSLWMWNHAIDEESMKQVQESCNSLPSRCPAAVVAAHPWEVGSKSPHHVKIVVPVDDMQCPTYLRDDREAETAEALRHAALVCPSLFMEVLLLGYYKCANKIVGRQQSDPTYYPTVSYSSANLIGQSYNPFGNGPGDSVFLLQIPEFRGNVGWCSEHCEQTPSQRIGSWLST